jgi:hypothetical protein
MRRRRSAVIRLDALNLMEALAERDRDKARGIMALYQDADSLASLAWVLANMAGLNLNAYRRRAGGTMDLAGLRAWRECGG